MLPENLRNLVNTVEEIRKNLLVSRGQEYAKDIDQLSTLKNIAAINENNDKCPGVTTQLLPEPAKLFAYAI